MISIKSLIVRNIANIRKSCSVRISSDLPAPVPPQNDDFETVFAFPFIKKLSFLHRAKVHHTVGSAVVIPGCGILEVLNILPNNITLTAAYISITGVVALCVATIPTINTIGFLYISEDNKKIKISFLDFWGRRVNKIIDTEQWIPLMDLPSRKMDYLFLTPQLENGKKFKLFLRYGKVLNSTKMGAVIE